MSLADRLKPYQVAHSLIHRLEIYDVSRPVSQFRSASWNTLLYWQLLIDEDDEGIGRLVRVDPDERIPTPDEWWPLGRPKYERIYEAHLSI